MSQRPAPIVLGLIGLAALAAGLGLSACAVLNVVSPADRALQHHIDQGRALARSQCLTCHQLDGVVEDLAPPPLTEVARRYRDARLDWELETIAQVGHYRMPAKALSASEIAALTVYIRSLDTTRPDDEPIRRGHGPDGDGAKRPG